MGSSGDMTDDSAEIFFQSFFAGGPCQQLWHGLGCPLFDVVRSAFPLPTTASPTLKGALKDGFGEVVVASDIPEPCNRTGICLINCQQQDLPLNARSRPEAARPTYPFRTGRILRCQGKNRGGGGGWGVGWIVCRQVVRCGTRGDRAEELTAALCLNTATAQYSSTHGQYRLLVSVCIFQL